MSDEETIHHIYRTQYQKLSPALQDMVLSEQIPEILSAFSSRNRLSVATTNDIEREIVLVLLGLERPEEFESNLVDEVGLEEGVAGSIAREIEQSIFEPVSDDLDDLWRRQTAADELSTDEDEGEQEELDRDTILHGIEDPDSLSANDGREKAEKLSEEEEPVELDQDARVRGYENGEDPYREAIE